jgi:hypothetical protein
MPAARWSVCDEVCQLQQALQVRGLKLGGAHDDRDWGKEGGIDDSLPTKRKSVRAVWWKVESSGGLWIAREVGSWWVTRTIESKSWGRGLIKFVLLALEDPTRLFASWCIHTNTRTEEWS